MAGEEKNHTLHLHFSHLADALIQSDLQLAHTLEPEKGQTQKGQTNGEPHSPTDSPSLRNIVRTKLEWDVPMSVPLPIEVISADQPLPFLDTTLADLGIKESSVKERVVWVDTKKTQVKNKEGKLKEKEITILEVRVKAQIPGHKKTQEVLYSTVTHTDRSFCRTGVDILPWKSHMQTVENGFQPVEMTMALDIESQPKEEIREVRGNTWDNRQQKQ